MKMTTLRSVLLLSLCAIGASACSGEDWANIRGAHGKNKKISDAEGPTEDGSVQEGEDETTRYTRAIDNSGANFQVKDVALLRSSITSCMGEGMLTVTADMILGVPGVNPAPADPSDNRFRFLLPGQYVAADDIIEKERGNMVDASSGARAGIAADALTDTFLRSIETVSNVVAHNCSADRPECQCSSKEQAREMLTRCLPGLDPETKEMDEAAEMLGLVCSSDGSKGMRRAIASMLSSYAFASAR